MMSGCAWKAIAACSGIAIAACTGLAIAAGSAHAGAVTSFGLSTWLDGFSASPSARGVWLGPAFALESGSAAVSLDTRLGPAGLAGGSQAGRLMVSLLADGPGPLEPELVLVATHRSGPSRETGVRPGFRYHLAGVRAGAWISASAEGTVGGAGSEGVHMPLLGFGAWARRHRLTVAGVLEQNVGLLPAAGAQPAPPDSTTPATDSPRRAANPAAPAPEQVLMTTAYTSIRWDGERVELESVGGVTVSALAPPRRWAQASLAVRLSPQLAVVAAAGSRSPQYFAVDPSGEPRAAVALRFSQWKSTAPRTTLAARAEPIECRVRSLGDGRYDIAVRAPGARLVELAGDMTQWEPVSLQPLGGERWEVVVEMSPGVHQVSLRTDGGAWMPPPGFPTASDGFSGAVGVVVAE